MIMEYNVSTPASLNVVNKKELDLFIKLFEEEIKVNKDNCENSDYYFFIVEGEPSKRVREKIEEIYKKAGWRDAECKTSSENGERGGLTSLKLYK